MSDQNKRPKDSDLQATNAPPDPELESLIAPQGYSPDMVDDIATMESPAQQRKAALRFGIIMLVLVGIACWFCTPANLIIPDFPDPPYNIFDRPQPPTNKFLIDAVPGSLAGLTRVDIREEQIFAKPYVGATVVKATYVDEIGNPATAIIFQANSYINARRVLDNYKIKLQEEAKPTFWQEKLYISENFIQWQAPGYADQAYGLAYNNEGYFVAITSPVQSTQEQLAKEFPY